MRSRRLTIGMFDLRPHVAAEVIPESLPAVLKPQILAQCSAAAATLANVACAYQDSSLMPIEVVAPKP
jgi:hypothetical protein